MSNSNTLSEATTGCYLNYQVETVNSTSTTPCLRMGTIYLAPRQEGELNGLQRIFGKWPGEESAEKLLKLVNDSK